MSWLLEVDGRSSQTLYPDPRTATWALCMMTGEAYMTELQDDGTYEVKRLRDGAIVAGIREASEPKATEKQRHPLLALNNLRFCLYVLTCLAAIFSLVYYLFFCFENR